MIAGAARQSDFQTTVTLVPSPLYRREEVARFLSTDGIVARLGDFPELTQAVRDQDLDKTGALCAQSFFSNFTPNSKAL